MDVRRKGGAPVLEIKKTNGVTFLSFPLLERTGLVRHAFSTRLGGVSQGDFATMNFSFTRGDDREAVLENYSRMAGALGVMRERMVLTWQTHTTNVRRVRERDYRDVDGLITDVPGMTLVTFFADCVPLYFLDPVHRAIGLSHSGWRGTVKRMGAVTLSEMERAFGTRPEDVLACIGPSICRDCYEVGDDVAGEFGAAFSAAACGRMLTPKKDRKFFLDLWEANRTVLLEAGVREDHLSVTDICTRCNPELLFPTAGARKKEGISVRFYRLYKKETESGAQWQTWLRIRS